MRIINIYLDEDEINEREKFINEIITRLMELGTSNIEHDENLIKAECFDPDSNRSYNT